MITNDRLLKLLERARIHEEVGEDDVRVSPHELYELVGEVLKGREHRCPTAADFADRRQEVWGYDG